MNVVLDDPVVRECLKHFRWSVVEGSSELLITYDFMDYRTLCLICGCLFLGDDPLFSLNVRGEDVECGREVFGFSECDRLLIVELFEYLECECPRKVLKRLVKEWVR